MRSVLKHLVLATLVMALLLALFGVGYLFAENQRLTDRVDQLTDQTGGDDLGRLPPNVEPDDIVGTPVDDFLADKPNAPYEFLGAQLVDNRILIDVRYAGGCDEHVFDLFYDVDAPRMLIFPPQIDAYLLHDNNGDTCEASITDVLEFDLDEIMADFSTNAIVLEIFDQDRVLLETFEYGDLDF